MISDSNFPVKITVGFEGAGAEQAGEALRKVGEHAQKSEINTRALHRALSALGPEFGELGELLHMAEFGAPLLALLGIGLAIGKVTEFLKGMRDHIRELTEDARKYGDSMEEALAKSAAASRSEAAAWDRARAAARLHQDQIAAQAEEILKLNQQYTEFANKQADADERRAQALISLGEAQGRIIGPEAARLKAEAQLKHADTEEATKEGSVRAANEIRDAEKTAMEVQREKHLDEAEDLRAQKTALDKQIARMTVDRDDQKRHYEALQATAETDFANATAAKKAGIHGEITGPMFDRAEESAKQALFARDAFLGTNDRIIDTQLKQGAINDRLKQLESWIDEASKSIKNLVDAINNSALELTNMAAAYKAVRATNIQTMAIEALNDQGVLGVDARQLLNDARGVGEQEVRDDRNHRRLAQLSLDRGHDVAVDDITIRGGAPLIQVDAVEHVGLADLGPHDRELIVMLVERDHAEQVLAKHRR